MATRCTTCCEVVEERPAYPHVCSPDRLRALRPRPPLETQAICLGDEVEDTVSGFTGVVTCRSQYLHGCDRITVQPRIDKAGLLPSAQTFDEPRLRRTETGKIGFTSTPAPAKPC